MVEGIAREQTEKEEDSTVVMNSVLTKGNLTIRSVGAVVVCKKTSSLGEICEVPQDIAKRSYCPCEDRNDSRTAAA